MAPILAVKTLAAINAALERDQGGLFRTMLKAEYESDLRIVGDAFRGGEDEGFRSHLGASLIGRECERYLWYNFRWVLKPSFEGRMVRLFNRGHLEEPRFVALLRMIGCRVWRYDEQGKQFRVAAYGGHFGGSLDSVVRGIPDAPWENTLGEFKTHSEKSFDKLREKGVQLAKPEHYVQMQTYMGGYSLRLALYMAVNKNNDELYLELVPFDPDQFARLNARAGRIVFADRPPKKISNSPGWYQCKICDLRVVCHLSAESARNCRTCIHSVPTHEGGWHCKFHNVPLSKADQLQGCPTYRWIPM